MRRSIGIPSYFEEEAYLYYNPDVADVVKSGSVESGYHHWLLHGAKEWRPGGPRRYAADRKVFVRRFEKRPYGVNLYGFLSTPSGVGEAARSCRAALTAAGVPVQPVDVPPWHLSGASRVAPAAEDRYRINVIQQNADMMRAFVQAYGEESLHGAYNIPFWFWELPSMLPEWFAYYEYADEIWTASEFCRRAISAMTGLPVLRMPMVIEGLEKRLSYGREHFGLPASVFAFGYVYDVNSFLERKNPLALVEAFRREFGDSPDVLLVLKHSYGGTKRNPDADRVEAAVAGASNIRVIDREFNASEITSFQNALDCFVSPHRTEGFGFNLAESMYLGKPVIATGYSGNVDFMDSANSYLVEYRLVPIKHTVGPYREGCKWADVDGSDLQRQMRRVFEHREEGKRKGAAARETIRKNYSADEAGRQMLARFRELGLEQPQVRRSLFSGHSTRGAPRFVHVDTPEDVRQQVSLMSETRLLGFSLVADGVPAQELRDRIESVRSQWYPYWELCVCSSDLANDMLKSYKGMDPRIRIVQEAPLRDPLEFSTAPVTFPLNKAIAPDFLLAQSNMGQIIG